MKITRNHSQLFTTLHLRSRHTEDEILDSPGDLTNVRPARHAHTCVSIVLRPLLWWSQVHFCFLNHDTCRILLPEMGLFSMPIKKKGISMQYWWQVQFDTAAGIFHAAIISIVIRHEKNRLIRLFRLIFFAVNKHNK